MAARPVTRGIDAKPVRVSAILGGDIRLEASTYLREGYGLTRLAKQVPGHTSLGELADIWQPSRLTGYTVPEGKGLPFSHRWPGVRRLPEGEEMARKAVCAATGKPLCR